MLGELISKSLRFKFGLSLLNAFPIRRENKRRIIASDLLVLCKVSHGVDRDSGHVSSNVTTKH